MNEPTFRIIKWLLKLMEEMKDRPDRNMFCANFDEVYEQRKKIYKDYTGKEWEGEGE